METRDRVENERMPRRFAPIFSACAAIALASCGGGGSGSTPARQATPLPTASPLPTSAPTLSPTNTPSPIPSATPMPTASPVRTASPVPTASPTGKATIATVTGTVVDFDTDAGLSGIPISIAHYASGGTYSTVAISAADGTFSFTTSPGDYVVAVGSNTASDTTRATEHDDVSLAAGSNAIGGPVETPVADVTPVPSQTSGNFRLATISSSEQGCVAAMNSGRASRSVPALMVDEETLELSRALLAEELAQQTSSPSPLFQSSGQGTYQATGESRYATGVNYASCSSFTNTYSFTSSSAVYSEAVSGSTSWFGASFGSSGGHSYVNEIFGNDPKNDTSGAQHR